MADIFGGFKEYSVAEFFKKNRQMLGFSGKVRSLTTIVHEYVTNSLDAAGEARMHPELEVWVEEVEKNERYKVRVKDNGPGIPENILGKALGMMLAGTKFHRYVQQRGQQGIGAAGCTMYSLISTGQPISVVSRHKGKKVSCKLGIDFKKNKPVLTDVVREDCGPEEHGLDVEGVFADTKYEKGGYGVGEYLKRTAIANPHATIIFNSPEGDRFVYPKSVERLPEKAEEVKPHPLGVGANDLLDIAKAAKGYTRLSAMLQNEFTRVSLNKVKELRDLVPDVNLDMSPSRLTWDDAEKLVVGFRKVKWIAPATDSVIPIGKEQIEKSLVNILNPELVYVTSRPPKIYRGGIPFVVEVGIAYGGDINKEGKGGVVMRFANRAPLLFDAGGCAITQTAKSVEWKRYEIKKFDEEPVAILVNLASVHVPYTSAGKQSVSSEDDVVEEIKNALMEAGRHVQKHLSGKRREREKSTKKKAILRYVGQISGDLAELAGEEKSKKEIEAELQKMISERFE
ncbi:DNA topoisomerase VI subunit B [Candidatus Micrarchaeota archaeon]|nr:DNA topoisomerase VI subunit B [Candidatus Micrarchaeota archaeon]MBD3418005.1 DNA topoisomerase VI subunit B [Candidatus Micrarchaeota archaeon]